jgi:hypothetical protein
MAGMLLIRRGAGTAQCRLGLTLEHENASGARWNGAQRFLSRDDDDRQRQWRA